MPKSESTKTMLVLGAAAAGLYFLANKSNAAGNNPAAPPTTTTTPPADVPTAAQQTQAQINWIYNQLAANGWVSSPLWYTATSTPTEIPQDTTGAGRNLVAKDQSVTDAYQQYFWKVNEFFGWTYPAGSGNSSAFATGGNFPGLTGANTNTPTTDPTNWAAMQTLYQGLTTSLTPTFLS